MPPSIENKIQGIYMNRLKNLAGETALYGMGTIVPRLFNFFLVPLHTAVFVPEDYGVITHLYAFVAFLNVVYLWGMETAYFRFATKPDADAKKVFNIAQTTVVTISLSCSLVLIGFNDPVASLLNLDGKGYYLTWLAGVMAIDSLAAIPFAKLRLEKKPLVFASAKIINVVLLVGLNFYFLKWAYEPSIGVGYVFLANLIANGSYLLFFGKTLLSWRPASDKQVTPAMLNYAYPVMLTGVAGMVNEMFSRLTLQWWLPENFYPGKPATYALGVFGACYKYAVFMNLTVQAFRFAAEPFFFSNASDKNSPALFAKVNYYFVIACCIILVAVSTNLDILKYILGDPEYWSGLGIVPILLSAYLFLGVYYNFSVWFKLTDKTHVGTFLTIGGAILTIAANYLLIPVLGYVGSSWAALLCYFSMAVACYLLGQKYFPIPYRLGKSLLYIVSALLLTFLLNSFTLDNLWLSAALHVGTLIACIFIIYAIERKELMAR
jgi:O-antigen/teichoic acid export membrane protein